jgi:putative tricarboxylic transport membrane protein
LAFVWLKVLGHEGWRTSIIASVAMVVAFYLVFVVALGTSIPHLF